MKPNALGQLLQLITSSRKLSLTMRVIWAPLFCVPTGPVPPTMIALDLQDLQQNLAHMLGLHKLKQTFIFHFPNQTINP